MCFLHSDGSRHHPVPSAFRISGTIGVWAPVAASQTKRMFAVTRQGRPATVHAALVWEAARLSYENRSERGSLFQATRNVCALAEPIVKLGRLTYSYSAVSTHSMLALYLFSRQR